METWLGLAGTRWSFFRCQKKAGAQRFIIDAHASNRHIFETFVWAFAHRRGTLSCTSSKELLRTLRTGLSLHLTSRDAFHQMRILGWLLAFFALPAVLAPDVGYTGKTVDQKRLAPRFSDTRRSYNASNGLLHGRCFSVQTSGITARSREVLDYPLFVCRDHSAPPLLGCKHGMGSAGFRWSFADNFGCAGSRRELHQRSSSTSYCRCTEGRLRYSRHIPCQRKCRDVLGYGVSPSSA